MSKGKQPHYINNKNFLAALIEYKKECKESIAAGGPERPYTKNYTYIGECIMLIAQRMTNRGNFNGYSYKDEFISDSILDCIARMDNFDPTRSSNPFAYFSQIIWNASIRRIKSEQKQKSIKVEMLKNSNIMAEMSDHISSDDDDYACYVENVQSLLECLEPVEKVPMDKALVKRNRSYSKKLKQMDVTIDNFEKDLYKDLDDHEEVVIENTEEVEE